MNGGWSYRRWDHLRWRKHNFKEEVWSCLVIVNSDYAAPRFHNEDIHAWIFTEVKKNCNFWWSLVFQSVIEDITFKIECPSFWLLSFNRTKGSFASLVDKHSWSCLSVVILDCEEYVWETIWCNIANIESSVYLWLITIHVNNISIFWKKLFDNMFFFVNWKRSKNFRY